jgi:ubiquinone/menaquinone biosynthesis C-methylase UbiE
MMPNQTVRNRLFNFYWAALRLLAPGLRNSQYTYKEVLRSYARPGVAWLDLGCGHQLLPDWMPSSRVEEQELLSQAGIFVGIDADVPSLRRNDHARHLVVGDIEILPVRGEAFDLVTANMVVEHVGAPRNLLHEVHRVLKPGSYFLFHTPNSWGYATLAARLLSRRAKIWLGRLLQGRKERDIFPTFYRMNSREKIERLARQAGLEIVSLSLVESSAQTPMLPPLVLLELVLIRALRANSLRRFRTNLIVVLRKPISHP